MGLSPRLRRFALTAHVVSSVGWLGALGLFFALSVAGLTADDAEAVRAAYTAMDLTVWSVLVPLALASLLTGVIQGLGTKWGLVRHYWVLAKLLLTVVATFVLLMYTDTIEAMAREARQPGPIEEVRNLSPALHAGVALIVLLSTTILGIYKPAGLTRYGWRKQQQLRSASRA
jgi:hypothetical protein